jgi:hypothetical protein
LSKWRRRFAERRIDGLLDEPRSGAPRQIGDDDVAEVIRQTLETAPQGATHWSRRSMAKAAGFAPSTIHRIWKKAFNLQRDIVGLYLSPPERAVVLCVDEKSQIQALDRTQPLLPMRPDKSSGAPTTTPATEPLACSQRSTRADRQGHRALLSAPSRARIPALSA